MNRKHFRPKTRPDSEIDGIKKKNNKNNKPQNINGPLLIIPLLLMPINGRSVCEIYNHNHHTTPLPHYASVTRNSLAN
jgi:hypothetical protein